jgi:hypothetical protein
MDKDQFQQLMQEARDIGLTDSAQILGIKERKVEFADSNYNVMYVDVVATHSDFTINNRQYPKRHVKSGVLSWTLPNEKPLLLNHDMEGESLGRIVDAKFVAHTKRMIDKPDIAPYMKVGTGHQELKLKVCGKDNVERVLDGRLDQGSVRFKTPHMWCSICKTDWLDPDVDMDECPHNPGRVYDGDQCFGITGELFYREYSFVNDPADAYSTTLLETVQQTDSNISYYCCGIDLAAESTSAMATAVDNLSKPSNDDGGPMTRKDLEQNEIVQEIVADAVVAARTEQAKESADKITELEGSLEDAASLKETISGLEDAQTALSKEKTELEKKVEDLQATVDSKDSELKQLEESNSKLAMEVHKGLAERLADLRIARGHSVDQKRDELVATFSKRTLDSLRDAIADALTEQVKTETTVSNPGLEHGDSASSKQKATVKPRTRADVISQGLGTEKGGNE